MPIHQALLDVADKTTHVYMVFAIDANVANGISKPSKPNQEAPKVKDEPSTIDRTKKVPDIREKDEKQSQNDKTKLRTERAENSKSKSTKKSTPQSILKQWLQVSTARVDVSTAMDTRSTKKQQTYKLIIGSTDVNVARYVFVLPMAVNTASLIFEGGNTIYTDRIDLRLGGNVWIQLEGSRFEVNNLLCSDRMALDRPLKASSDHSSVVKDTFTLEEEYGGNSPKIVRVVIC
ncbi:hypothetical protein Tco_1538321 [Tanacetum coccineum]